MPIVYRDADIFATDCEALVNPVNCVGVMGRGLALAFKRRYPAHFAAYRRACRAGTLRPGTVHVDDLGPGASPRFLVALPTKRHWRDPARLDDVARSVRALAGALVERRIASVAIPKLGCGLGGLAWPDVHRAIAPVLAPAVAAGCRIVVLGPRPHGPAPGRREARATGQPTRTGEGASMHVAVSPDTTPMAPRYVIRTVDEDWIDLFDAPARIRDKRAAWDEAKRRVRAHPECTTLVIDRRTGAILWRSEPDIAPRYEVVAVNDTVFYALETDLALPGDVLSSHKAKDDAWTAFHAAIEEPVGDDIIVLRDTLPGETILASSDDDLYHVDAERGR